MCVVPAGIGIAGRYMPVAAGWPPAARRPGAVPTTGFADLACGCVSRPGKRAQLPCPLAPEREGPSAPSSMRGRVPEGAFARANPAARRCGSSTASGDRATAIWAQLIR